MSDIWDYSSTASSNTSVDGININTGMSPANVDNALRTIIAVVRASLHADLENFLKGAAGLPIASGGTGATSAATALAALGGLEDDYRDLVRVDKSSNFTISNAERGYGIGWTGAGTGTCTLNPNATTAINPGAVFVLYNGGGGVLTVTRGSGVSLYKNGSAVSADAAIAIRGQATLICWSADHWTINGVGVS